MRGGWWAGVGLLLLALLLLPDFWLAPPFFGFGEPWILLRAAWAGMLLLPPAFFFRNQCYKSAWHRFAVAPRGYFFGNAVLLSIALVTLLLSLLALTSGSLLAVLPMALALTAYLANYPRATPLQSHPPRLAAGR